jgi:integrase
MTGKNLWRLCKVYGRQIGYPMLRPHDLRHGVAMEIYEQHGDPEEVRAMLGHKRLETTQVYMRIRPRQLKQAVAFYNAAAREVARTGFEPVFGRGHVFASNIVGFSTGRFVERRRD